MEEDPSYSSTLHAAAASGRLLHLQSALDREDWDREMGEDVVVGEERGPPTEQTVRIFVVRSNRKSNMGHSSVGVGCGLHS